MLHPILCLTGKRKEIFDLIFDDVQPFTEDKTSVAIILLNYEDKKLKELFEEVQKSDNKIEVVLSKADSVVYKDRTTPPPGILY